MQLEFRFNDSFMLLQIFLEQKKMLKTGLNITHFKEHVKLIETETVEYFRRWGDGGERSKLLCCLKYYYISVRWVQS